MLSLQWYPAGQQKTQKKVVIIKHVPDLLIQGGIEWKHVNGVKSYNHYQFPSLQTQMHRIWKIMEIKL